MARCFGDTDESNRVVVEDFEVLRTATKEYSPNRRREVPKWLYRLVRPVRPDQLTGTEKQRIDGGTEVVAHGAHAAQPNGLASGTKRPGSPEEES